MCKEEWKDMDVNEKYYDGFEGEPEITFCLVENNSVAQKIGVWDGYFNSIMRLIQPEKEGWTGLAYFYHLYIGWYEEDNWFIPDILETYDQLANIDSNELVNREEKEVLILIVNMLKRAIEHNGKVYIVYD